MTFLPKTEDRAVVVEKLLHCVRSELVGHVNYLLGYGVNVVLTGHRRAVGPALP